MTTKQTIKNGDLRVLLADRWIANISHVSSGPGVGELIAGGSILRVALVQADAFGGIMMLDLITGLGTLMLREEYEQLTVPPRIPIDVFENEQSFREALAADRKEAIRQLMERKVDEWLEDSRRCAIGCLTQWALDGLNLGDDRTLVKLADNQFEDVNHDPPGSG